jgi:hypothetical protein
MDHRQRFHVADACLKQRQHSSRADLSTPVGAPPRNPP